MTRIREARRAAHPRGDTTEAASEAPVALEPPEVLYEDQWCIVDGEGLLIKCYFFPTGGSRRVAWARLAGARRHAESGPLNTKGWGMAADFGVWWACDLGRSFSRPTSQLLIVSERKPRGADVEWPEKGFTCADPERVLALLERREHQSRPAWPPPPPESGGPGAAGQGDDARARASQGVGVCSPFS